MLSNQLKRLEDNKRVTLPSIFVKYLFILLRLRYRDDRIYVVVNYNVLRRMVGKTELTLEGARGCFKRDVSVLKRKFLEIGLFDVVFIARNGCAIHRNIKVLNIAF